MDILSILRQEWKKSQEKFKNDSLDAYCLPWEESSLAFFVIGAIAGYLLSIDVLGWGDWDGTNGVFAGGLHGLAALILLRIVSKIFPAPFAWLHRRTWQYF